MIRRSAAMWTLALAACGTDPDPEPDPLSGRIAFVSVVAGNRDIYVAGADDLEVTRLTFDPAADREPAWSPDGSRLVFTSDRGGAPGLHLMDADGTNVVPLTAVAGFMGGQAAWSPDGSRIAYRHDGAIHLINSDGSGVQRLDPVLPGVPPGACVSASEPSWSSTGQHIAFLGGSCASSPHSLYRMRTDGTDVTLLVDAFGGAEPVSLLSPTLSPVDERLVYARTVRIRLNTLDTRLNIGGPDTIRAREPAWSPDAAHVVFIGELDPTGAGKLYVIDADGANARKLDVGMSAEQPAWGPGD